VSSFAGLPSSLFNDYGGCECEKVGPHFAMGPRVMRGMIIVVGALSLFGCGGEIGQLPETSTGFDALVNATPERVQPGQWVRFEVQVKSKYQQAVVVNLALRLVEDSTNKVVFTQKWDGIHFQTAEVYNLTQNYLSATDTGRIPHRVELEARSVETGEVVWSDSATTIIEFGS
jgi:hypothetical protein